MKVDKSKLVITETGILNPESEKEFNNLSRTIIRYLEFKLDMKTDMLDDEIDREKEDRDEDWIECIEMEIEDLKEMLAGLYKIKLERL